MSNSLIEAMFGKDSNDVRDPSTSKKLVTESMALEIKAKDKDFVSIKIGTETIVIPVAKYVQRLEELVQKQDRELKRMAADAKRTRSVVDKLGKDISSIDKELKDKMDKF